MPDHRVFGGVEFATSSVLRCPRAGALDYQRQPHRGSASCRLAGSRAVGSGRKKPLSSRSGGFCWGRKMAWAPPRRCGHRMGCQPEGECRHCCHRSLPWRARYWLGVVESGPQKSPCLHAFPCMVTGQKAVFGPCNGSPSISSPTCRRLTPSRAIRFRADLPTKSASISRSTRRSRPSSNGLVWISMSAW